MCIEELIKKCGGAQVICDVAKNYGRKITYKAVRKWVRNGIPAYWFSVVIELSGCTADDIHNCNENLKRDEAA